MTASSDPALPDDVPAAGQRPPGQSAGRLPTAWWMPPSHVAGAVPTGTTLAVPDTPVPGGGRDLRADAMGFVEALRAAGLAVPPSRAIDFLTALAALEPPDVLDTFWAGRSTLVGHPDDRATYDLVFRTHFVGAWTSPDVDAETAEPETVWVDGPGADDQPTEDDDEQRPGAVASATEALRHRRFDQATDGELAAMRRLMSRIEIDVPRRRWRRTRPHRRGGRLDVGRSLRRALRTDGEVVDRIWRRRRVRRRPLVLLLDVSGSMSDYSRALLQFAFAATVKAEKVEVFAFGTRLTRLTDQLRESDPDAALAGAARAVVDWDSGTRIGASLDTLHRRWGRRGLLRGAVVLVASDGLERGEVDLLRASMERLGRQAHAVVWVNPLKVDPRYQPLARGMAAALPSIDHFLPGHDVASLDALADVIAAA